MIWTTESWPRRDAQAGTVAAGSPVVLMSGFSTVQTSATVAAIRQIGLSGGYDEPERPMFAVVVPNALEKRLGALCQELEADHFANARKEAPTQSS